MWDKPAILNRLSNALFAAGALLAAYGVLAHVVQLPYFALREIQVTGSTQHITRAQVEAIVANELKGTFFTLNLPAVRTAFEKLPWVRTVNLRRQWPARLEVEVEEHVPLARWGNAALVNTHGEVFRAAYSGPLPVLVGPPGSAKELAIQYEFFRRNLAAIHAKPVMVQLTPRRAWEVRIENGPTLALGREDVEARLARYIGVHDTTVGALGRRIDYVDLRYGNGFAVRIRELKGEAVDRQGTSAATKRRVRRT
jgi:cell division protein FtsQ